MARRRFALALLSLTCVVAGCASANAGHRTRSVDSKLLHRISRSVDSAWKYEASSRDAGKPPPFVPHVLRIAVSSVDPRYVSALVQLRDKRGQPHGSRAVVILERSISGMGPVDGPALAFPDPCAAGRPAGVRSLICPNPWTVFHLRPPQVDAQTTLTQRIPTADLRKVAWSSVQLPGGVCGSSRAIRLRKWYAGIHPDVDLLWWNPVEVFAERPVFGGRNEAALVVGCANNGGTADGQLAFSVVVFQAQGHTLRTLGILRPNAPLNPYLGHVPLVAFSKFRGDAISVTETWYGAEDGTCCGSGRATTVWTYRRGSFHARTTIAHKPWSSPITIGDFLAPCGDNCRRIHLTPRLHFTVWLSDYRKAKNVSLTLTIRQGTRTIRETKSLPVLTAALGGKLVFGSFHHLKPGVVKVTVDLHRPGAFPFTYRYTLTRP